MFIESPTVYALYMRVIDRSKNEEGEWVTKKGESLTRKYSWPLHTYLLLVSYVDVKTFIE